MGTFLVIIIETIGRVLTLAIIIDAVLSFILSPYHPVREAFGRILNPLYAPIRRVLPSMGGFDFSPLVLILLIQVVVSLLVSLVSLIR
jgi:YggT family protein|uniref:YggT family protein n=1 Tax=Anaerolinea thermolimosa TaxID=229919 RepID=A0A7C4PIF5_9CHLR